MGFGDFGPLCTQAALPLCTALGPERTEFGSGARGLLPKCYERDLELANTEIFEAATCVVHLFAVGTTVIMILHVRSKFTAVGRREILTFFYLYMALTLLSLVLDAGVAPPGGSAYPWLAAIQNGLASAVCMTLMINGFVGFQLYEDGTPLSVLLLRGSATAMFALSFVISVLTFNGIGSLSPTQTLPLFVVLYVLNAVCLAVYVVMQTLLVATLGDRWPLGHIFFGVGSFVAGQVLLYAFSTTICERTKHYVDGLLFATFCNLVSVMMVYRYWDSITTSDLEFSVGIKPNNWVIENDPLLDEDRRGGIGYRDNVSDYAPSYHD